MEIVSDYNFISSLCTVIEMRISRVQISSQSLCTMIKIKLGGANFISISGTMIKMMISEVLISFKF